MRKALAAAVVLGLTACAGAPKKSGPDAAGAKPAASSSRPATGRKVSPYAPAQEDPSTRGNYTAGGLYKPGVLDSTPDYVPDVDAIPEPEVVDEPRSAIGNRPSYTVLGKTYRVMDDHRGFVETGTASYYGQKFHGRRTSNMEVYDMFAFTAAHKSLPLPSFARVTNLDNGKSVVVRVNDRGPFHDGRVVDLSYAAAVKLDIVQKGTGRVEVRALTPGEDGPLLAHNRREKRGARGRARTDADAVPVVPSAMDRLVSSIPADTPADIPARTGPVASATPPATAETPVEHRFDMRQDGRSMTADEFDAWMKARQIRIATGRPATPPTRSAAAVGTVHEPVVREPAASQPAASQPAVNQPAVAPAPDQVILQIASFAARANADRALTMLRDAGIEQVRLLDAEANGRPVWRLHVGPLAEAAAPGLAARLVDLGFGPPHRVRD
ncbi:septal ring lytic transglycosylase RlpA family protein [Marilutibacter alkalisoli]|uniref:Endolytic peptidoglycan transglycosylase RlpA n=1 Tax=Marilutibacter alkalisoli TaxID=2591633 RepID=A0A514BUW0_9GAMM|nr:septal ring lytic transglycosylase RlpA family protein [Lysobacter alkalisoli]QDH71191.1 septal ring lytic transglycosylase RlpA family protein [Lysobacter alkalisoli]